jgi:hypothetical protein
MTFEDGSCGGAGKYRFLVKESVLSFLPLGDGCGKRKAVMTGEWKRGYPGAGRELSIRCIAESWPLYVSPSQEKSPSVHSG